MKNRKEEIDKIMVDRQLTGLPIITVLKNSDFWNKDNKDSVKIRKVFIKLIKYIQKCRRKGIKLPFGFKLESFSSSLKENDDS